MRPDTDRSWFPMVGWATDGTVSVSTVMFRRGGSLRDLMAERDESEGLLESGYARWVDAERISCILPLSILEPASLSRSPARDSLALRSSVILDDVTSFRCSSGNLGPVGVEDKLI